MSGPRGTRARRWKADLSGALEWLIPLILLTLLLWAVMGPAFFSSTRYFGTPGDSNQYMWFIGWFWWALQHGRAPAMTAAFNYPTPINIMDYTSVPALGLLFGWLYPIAGMVFTYNVIIIINDILIFVFGKLTIRALGGGRLMSGVGGLLFCLLPYLTAQEWTHLDLVVVAPLFALGYLIVRVTRSARRPGWAAGLLIGLALLLAFYTFVETFLTALLCLLVVYACGLLCARQATAALTARLASARFLLGVAAPLALAIPGVVNFVQGQGAHPPDFSPAAGIYSNDLLSLIIPSQVYLLHTSATDALTGRLAGSPTEVDAYLTLPFIALVVMSAIRNWSDPLARTLAHAAGFMLLLSFGPFLAIAGVKTFVPLPWLFILLFRVPFLHDAWPARLALYAEYLALMLVVVQGDTLVRNLPALRRPQRAHVSAALYLAGLALVALLWLPRMPYPSSAMPQAATIIRTDHVATRFLRRSPTFVLNNTETGFNVVMGILADSQSYDLIMSNIYGYSMGSSLSVKTNNAFIHDADGKQTALALRQYLPQMGVGQVMFVSIDDQPLDAQRLQEITGYLGPPLYNEQGLVVIWSAIPVTARAAPSRPLT